MSFSKEETVQEKIKELSGMDSSSEQYLGKYNKTLKAIVNLKEIYTVVSRNTTNEEIENNSGQIFCGLNNNIPTMWLFTEEQIAKEYAEYYK